MRVLTIVGARPQFIKVAPMSLALRARGHDVYVAHTGQHYDRAMSAVFFRDLDMPPPDINLDVRSGSHGQQTGQMLIALERVFDAWPPDCVLVFGDTNSTLAGGLIAAKRAVPLVHVEAGLRSFNRHMPEEINRVLVDRLSDVLFCSSEIGRENLAMEGIAQRVHVVGDLMADALALVSARTDPGGIARTLDIAGSYLVATVHRAENTDDPARLRQILAAFDELPQPVLMPVHPRTRKVLGQLDYQPRAHVHLLDPCGYVDMLGLMKGAHAVLTDSGGMQKEAYWLGVPCITLRDETEWVETVETGWNVLTGADRVRIVQAVQDLVRPTHRPPLYGDGRCATRCVEILEERFSATVPGAAAAGAPAGHGRVIGRVGGASR